MVVSPARGIWHPKELAEQAHLIAGAALGAVHTRRDDQPVSAAYDGVLVEWLVQDGDLVDAGDPLARVHPMPVPVGDRA
ncbi:MAG: biotin/lipoyl-binding protein [Mycobacteriales bacterium]